MGIRALPRFVTLPESLSALSSLTDKRRLVAGPGWDFLFFYFAPVIGLALAYLIYYRSPLPRMPVVAGYFLTWDQLFISVLNQGHLFLVFWRSHLNAQIFKTHPFRFTVVPVLAVLAMCVSEWAFVLLAVLALLWGEYHFSLQTFGLSRIYDSRAGNAPTAGRTQDRWMNHALYFGPLLAGPNITRLLFPFEQFSAVRAESLTRFPAFVLAHAHEIRLVVVSLVVLYVIYYVAHVRRRMVRGDKISLPKMLLIGLTGLVSIAAWGFMPLGVAIFVMHFYHCSQYFAIVWCAERRNLTALKEKKLRVPPRFAPAAAAFCLLAIPATYGLFAVLARALPHARGMLIVVITVSLCHLWFDGFIWSVKRKQI